MKAELVGKKSVRVTLTIKQAALILEAAESLSDHMAHSGSKLYSDVLKAAEKFGVAIEVAKARGES